MFMDQSYHSKFKAPEERNISHESHIVQNISLLWSWRWISDLRSINIPSRRD